MAQQTAKQRARYRAIVRELSRLSTGGWAQASCLDYVPLERELRHMTTTDCGLHLDAARER